MKKITTLIVALFAIIACASAQKGEKSVGLSLGYGTGIESIGIGAHFNYNITEKIRLAPDFTYFFENNSWNQWDLNLNAHYLFPLENKLTVYPIAGLIISHASFWNAYSDTKLGINVGGGIQYDAAKNLFFNGELKYAIVSDFDQAVISVGVGYKF